MGSYYPYSDIFTGFTGFMCIAGSTSATPLQCTAGFVLLNIALVCLFCMHIVLSVIARHVMQIFLPNWICTSYKSDLSYRVINPFNHYLVYPAHYFDNLVVFLILNGVTEATVQ